MIIPPETRFNNLQQSNYKGEPKLQNLSFSSFLLPVISKARRQHRDIKDEKRKDNNHKQRKLYRESRQQRPDVSDI